jgi:DNA-binding transcriptional ArsR family regulator
LSSINHHSDKHPTVRKDLSIIRLCGYYDKLQFMKQHHLPETLHPQDMNTVTRMFKTLTEAPRIRLVLLLHKDEKNVGELVEGLELPQSTVSRHLALLRSAELVTTRRVGTHVFYKLKSSHVGDLLEQAFAHAEHERRGLPDHLNGK